MHNVFFHSTLFYILSISCRRLYAVVVVIVIIIKNERNNETSGRILLNSET